MAVQPDKRPKDVQDEAAGTNVTERYRHGRYWLGALAMLRQPSSFVIRRDGSSLVQGSVWRDSHLGWMTVDERADVEHRDAGPGECLRWWALRQDGKPGR
jgi:hypothetical protein